jgi:hypothetical protein
MAHGQLFESVDPATEGDETAPEPEQSLAPAGEAVRTRIRPTPHKSKLGELLNNSKVPAEDVHAVVAAIRHYEHWIGEMLALTGTGDDKVRRLVSLLNDYKRQVEVDLIWDSRADFLFRQRGQLKLDNSIIEEFLPWLVDPDIIPELATLDVFAGPAGAFAATYFSTTLTSATTSIGLRVRTKNQDFTLSRQAFIKASFDRAFPADRVDEKSMWLAYAAAECKTNLDKTMFQEASATAHDLKVALPGSRYYVICEYLDMTPISTAGTDIDEVLILRGKRLPANKRNSYSAAANRRQSRDEYLDYLRQNPIRDDVVIRFVDHLRALLIHRDPAEDDVVTKGYF